MTQGQSSTDRGAIGSGTTSDQNMHYNTPPIQIGNAVRDGDQFLLLVKSRQSAQFQVWSSGDPTQAKDLFTQARKQVDELTSA
jgi:hypothetical protein